VAPIRHQRRRYLYNAVHQVGLQQFRKSVLRQSTVTDSIGKTIPDTRSSSSKGTVAERRVHSDHFQHPTTSTTCPKTTTTSPAAVGDEVFWRTFIYAFVHQDRHFVLYALPDWHSVEDLQHRSRRSDVIGASCNSHQTGSGIGWWYDLTWSTDWNRSWCNSGRLRSRWITATQASIIPQFSLGMMHTLEMIEKQLFNWSYCLI